MIHARPLAVLVLAFLAPVARAQERRVPEEVDHDLERFLANLPDPAQDTSLRSTCRVIQERIDVAGDELATSDGRVYIPERLALDRKIFEIGPQGLSAYREMFDARARELYGAGVSNRDPAAMARVRRHFFASSFGSPATLWLARWHMDRREFDRAAGLLGELEPTHEVLLRLAACYRGLGDAEGVREVLERLGGAGRDLGSPALRAYLSGGEEDEAGPGPGALRLRWALPLLDTRGADPFLAVRARYQEGLGWGLRFVDSQGPELGELLDELLQRHRPSLAAVSPVLSRGVVYLKAGDRMVGVDPARGEVRWTGRGTGPGSAGLELSASSSWRYHEHLAWHSIAAREDAVYCLEDLSPGSGPVDGNWLATYPRSGIGGPFLVWPAERLGGRFTGPLVADGTRLLVSTRDEQGRHALSAIGPELARLWSVPLGADRPFRPAGSRSSREERVEPPPAGDSSALAVQGGIAYWVGDIGWIVALDAATGERLWVAAYPSRRPRAWRTVLDDSWLPSTPVRSGRHLVVAPVDADSLLCLEAATGREVWRQPRERQWLLLGARGGLVYTAGEGVVARRVDRGGAIEWERSDLQAAGRAALQGGHVWLAASRTGGMVGATGIYRLDGSTGETIEFLAAPEAEGHDVALGNLIVAGDLVLSAGPRALLAFGPGEGAAPDLVVLLEEGRASYEAAVRAGDRPPLRPPAFPETPLAAYQRSLARARKTGSEDDWEKAFRLAPSEDERLPIRIVRLETATSGRGLAETLELAGRFHEDYAQENPRLAPASLEGAASIVARRTWLEGAWTAFIAECERRAGVEGMTPELARSLRVAPLERLPACLRWALACWLDDAGLEEEAIPHLRILCALEGAPESPERQLAGEALRRLVDAVLEKGRKRR